MPALSVIDPEHDADQKGRHSVTPPGGSQQPTGGRSSWYRIAADQVRLPREVPKWHDQGAACRLFPEIRDAWHDAKPGSAEKVVTRMICAACPVRLACATSALERGEPYGMWGGLDRADRKAVAARFGYPPPGDPPPHGTNARRVKWGCTCAECRAAHALYEAERRSRAQQRRQKRARSPRHLVAFGKRVRELRQAQGLSPTRLAERARLTREQVAAVERGHVELNAATVTALVRGLAAAPADRQALAIELHRLAGTAWGLVSRGCAPVLVMRGSAAHREYELYGRTAAG